MVFHALFTRDSYEDRNPESKHPRERRTFLSKISAISLCFASIFVRAADARPAVFRATRFADALRLYMEGEATEKQVTLHPLIHMEAPEVAENGQRVEISIECKTLNVRRVALFAEDNPVPLVGIFEFFPPALPYIKFQIKLARSTFLRLLVSTADGKTHVIRHEIRVVSGGCLA